MIGTVVKLVLALAIGVPLIAWLLQDRMLFMPRPVGVRPGPRPGLEEVTVTAADGARLRGWLVRSAPARGPAPLVIYFGGNAEEVSWLTGVADRFAGWSLLLVNYRGYGDSEGAPGEAAMLADGLALHDFAVARADVDPDRVVALGRSLGSAVAVHLAAHRPLRGVVLVSPFDSMVEVARGHYPFLPVSLLLRHRFESLALAPGIDAPLLCLTAAEDRIVPPPRSRALFEAWGGARTRRELPDCGHNDISADPEFWHSIAAFLHERR